MKNGSLRVDGHKRANTPRSAAAETHTKLESLKINTSETSVDEMERSIDLSDVTEVAALMNAEIQALSLRNTKTIRAIRRKYSRMLKPASPEFVLQLARELLKVDTSRWIAYELIRAHKPTFASLGSAELEELGQGIDSWWTADSFARILAEPAWLHGQIPDRLILKWARLEDRWWHRASLVSTVALNVQSDGGTGDVSRTFRICRLLANDHDDMVAKAMSWALREPATHDAQAVREFLATYDGILAARVKREVTNKLRTGVKNPKRKINVRSSELSR